MDNFTELTISAVSAQESPTIEAGSPISSPSPSHLSLDPEDECFSLEMTEVLVDGEYDRGVNTSFFCVVAW